jgi:CBS domain-containing protein
MMRRVVPDVVRNQELLELSALATVREAADRMRSRHVGAVLITRDGQLDGIFTERDMVYRVVAEGRDPDRTPLAEVMTRNPDTVRPDTTAIDALRRMQDGGYRHLPVLDRGRIVGIVSRRDFFGLEKARLEEESDLWRKIG